jgi:hypothetical protein
MLTCTVQRAFYPVYREIFPDPHNYSPACPCAACTQRRGCYASHAWLALARIEPRWTTQGRGRVAVPAPADVEALVATGKITYNPDYNIDRDAAAHVVRFRKWLCAQVNDNYVKTLTLRALNCQISGKNVCFIWSEHRTHVGPWCGVIGFQVYANQAQRYPWESANFNDTAHNGWHTSHDPENLGANRLIDLLKRVAAIKTLLTHMDNDGRAPLIELDYKGMLQDVKVSYDSCKVVFNGTEYATQRKPRHIAGATPAKLDAEIDKLRARRFYLPAPRKTTRAKR